MASGICPREREASIVLRWRHARRRPAPSVHGRIATASHRVCRPTQDRFGIKLTAGRGAVGGRGHLHGAATSPGVTPPPVWRIP